MGAWMGDSVVERIRRRRELLPEWEGLMGALGLMKEVAPKGSIEVSQTSVGCSKVQFRARRGEGQEGGVGVGRAGVGGVVRLAGRGRMGMEVVRMVGVVVGAPGIVVLTGTMDVRVIELIKVVGRIEGEVVIVGEVVELVGLVVSMAVTTGVVGTCASLIEGKGMVKPVVTVVLPPGLSSTTEDVTLETSVLVDTRQLAETTDGHNCDCSSVTVTVTVPITISGSLLMVINCVTVWASGVEAGSATTTVTGTVTGIVIVATSGSPVNVVVSVTVVVTGIDSGTVTITVVGIVRVVASG